MKDLNYVHDANPNKNIFCKELAFSDISKNSHSQIEIFYVIKGSASVTINNATKILYKNQMCISDSFDVHSYSISDNLSKAIYVVIPDLYTSKLDAHKTSKRISENFVTEERLAIKFKLFLDLLSELKNKNNVVPKSLFSKGLILSILGLILDNVPLEEKLSKNTIITTNIVNYINDHYHEKLTLEGVAEHFGYSKYYFSKLFNKTFNCHFNDYLNHVRCRGVVAYLNSIPNQTILNAIMNSGFSSPSAFYKFFKDNYTISPSELKNIKTFKKFNNINLSALMKIKK